MRVQRASAIPCEHDGVRAAPALLLLPLAGCDLLFQLQHVDGSDGGQATGDGAPVPRCTGTSKLRSTFDDDAALARDWDKMLDAGTSAAIVDHALVVTAGVPTGYVNVTTNTAFDFRGGMAQTRLVDGSVTANAETFFEVRLPTVDRARCYIGMQYDTTNSTYLVFVCKSDTTGELPGSKLVTYDPVAHRYLRMQQQGTGMLFFTSVDGFAWTQRNQIDTPLYSYASVVFLYGAGAYDPGVSQPTRGSYDDFELCTP